MNVYFIFTLAYEEDLLVSYVGYVIFQLILYLVLNHSANHQLRIPNFPSMTINTNNSKFGMSNIADFFIVLC